MSRHLLLSYLLRTARGGDGVPDAELLRRFVADRDEAAFELLVRRHADAVWRACRRVAGQHADAEDAFQATFLALARKAGAVRGSAAGWLHRVAVNAALKARAKTGRAGLPLIDVPAPADDRADAAAVHEEVARLPDRYRLPVVLCDLEGRTHAEAAAELGWPVGTVSGRLSRARDQLRARLARRGIAGAAVVGADPLTAGADLIRAAVLVGVGGRPVPVAVASLTMGAIAAMNTSKWIAAAVVATAGVAGTGTAWVLAQDKGQGQPAPKPTQAPAVAVRGPADPNVGDYRPDLTATAFPNIPPKQDDGVALAPHLPRVLPTDDATTRLRKQKLLATHAMFRQAHQGKLLGKDVSDLLGNPGRAVAAAAEELWPNDPAALRPWLEWRVGYTKWQEQEVRRESNRYYYMTFAYFSVHRDRLDAELALLTLNTR